MDKIGTNLEQNFEIIQTSCPDCPKLVFWLMFLQILKIGAVLAFCADSNREYFLKSLNFSQFRKTICHPVLQ